jgi:hypothetical protein
LIAALTEIASTLRSPEGAPDVVLPKTGRAVCGAPRPCAVSPARPRSR